MIMEEKACVIKKERCQTNRGREGDEERKGEREGGLERERKRVREI